MATWLWPLPGAFIPLLVHPSPLCLSFPGQASQTPRSRPSGFYPVSECSGLIFLEMGLTLS